MRGLKCTEDDWVENFQLSTATFHMLCERIEVYIKWQNTQFHQCICVEHHVAITLWTLATCSEYYDIQSKWPKSKELVHWSPFWICSLHSLCDSTCKVIVDVLLKEHIQFSNGRDLVNVIEGFKSKLNMDTVCWNNRWQSYFCVTPSYEPYRLLQSKGVVFCNCASRC